MIVEILALIGAAGLASVLVPLALQCVMHRPQNLKLRYAAEWAVVTGGSSGIGRSLCHKLARQGLSVVVVAVADTLLEETEKELRKAYPAVAIRAVGADLSRPGYLERVAAATEDIKVQLLFNNAGFMVTGFFSEIPLARWLANLECNATASVALTHLFVSRMRASGITQGAVAFTSSPAGIIPSPFASMYGASKSLLTHFATSLACELAPEGIDVTVAHPSPVATRFYDLAHAMPTLRMFQSTATGPDAVAESLIRGLGRTVVCELGYYPIALRLLLRLIDITLLSELLSRFAASVEDYRFLKASAAAPGKGVGDAPAPRSR